MTLSSRWHATLRGSHLDDQLWATQQASEAAKRQDLDVPTWEAEAQPTKLLVSTKFLYLLLLFLTRGDEEKRTWEPDLSLVVLVIPRTSN